MKARLAISLILFAVLLSPLHAANDLEVAARKAALDVAGAFSNDGFKLRDGSWCGSLETGKAQLIQVNLYAGNQYWFTIGTSGTAKVAVTIFDEKGKALAFEPYSDAGRAAAGYAPETSGPHYVKVEELEGEPATFCLLYSYK